MNKEKKLKITKIINIKNITKLISFSFIIGFIILLTTDSWTIHNEILGKILLASFLTLGLLFITNEDDFLNPFLIGFFGTIILVLLFDYNMNTTIDEIPVYLENQKVETITNNIWDEDGVWYKITSDNYPDGVVMNEDDLEVDGHYLNGIEIIFPENININPDNPNISKIDVINNK